MTKTGRLIRFKINKHGAPRVVDVALNDPNPDLEVGIFCPELFVQENGKWKVWSRHDVKEEITVQVWEPDRGTGFFRVANARQLNTQISCTDRTASAYPVKTDPTKNYKCTLCGNKPFWSTWCYNTHYQKGLRGNTNGRILHFCMSCTMNGTPEESKRSCCKIDKTQGTDTLIYHYEDRDDMKLTRRKLIIKCRIKAENIPLINSLKVYPFRRWWDIDSNLLTVKGL